VNNNERSVKSVDVCEQQSVNKVLFNNIIDVHGQSKIASALA